jgi:hypothetical protein
MRDAAIDDAAAAILALINSVPWTPNASKIAAVIRRVVAVEGVPSSRLAVDLRQRRQALHSAITEALEVERTPAYEPSCAKARCRLREFDDLAEQVWQQAVQSWDDVVMRAEVALAYHQDVVDGTIEGLAAACPFERSMAELLAAVTAMGLIDGDHPSSPGTVVQRSLNNSRK